MQSYPGIEWKVRLSDVSGYKPKKVTSKTWRECIKKIWEAEPLRCKKCGGEMKIIAFITDFHETKKILKHK